MALANNSFLQRYEADTTIVSACAKDNILTISEQGDEESETFAMKHSHSLEHNVYKLRAPVITQYVSRRGACLVSLAHQRSIATRRGTAFFLVYKYYSP